MDNQERASREKVSLIFGSFCAILGGLGYLLLGFAHGDMPSEPDQALQHVAHHTNWQLIHISTIFSVFLWVVAFISLAFSINKRASAWFLSRLSVVSIMIGVTLFAVDYSIDGYSFPALAKAYEAASPTEKEMIYGAFYALFSELGATFPLYISFMLGLPFLLAGMAVVFSKRYPAWIGWIATLCGLGNFIAGVTMFIDHPVVPEDMVFGGFGLLLNLWLVIIGILMWQQARKIQV
ncbi:hypothetical protein [Pseudalkalibacillus decolorationis]|uniref:hypothetical protein n=1 Tax=Pseudalkalibacillus decolorationis TaxID=163879 RepID=UPI002147C49A|nr:hypothetical protein [Pseudalkalibacillus decolorationis]